MRAIIQRTNLPAFIKVKGQVTGKINKGLVVYIGIENTDDTEDINWLSKKIVNMRIFNDEEGKMNLDLKQYEGEILLISQFTLFASTKKGNRPSFLRSAKPDMAIPLYEEFIDHLRTFHNINVSTGIFGADMKVNYVNDGPVSIILDSKNKE